MRISVKGFYSNKLKENYIFTDPVSNEIKLTLKPGAIVNLGHNCCYETVRTTGRYKEEAPLSIRKKTKNGKYIYQHLPNNADILLATDSNSGINGLIKFYKRVSRYDKLTAVLEHIDFREQYVKFVPTLEGVEIEEKSGYVPECVNFSPDKNWYEYLTYTDSTNWSGVSYMTECCVNCKMKLKRKSEKCQGKISVTAKQFENGTYCFIVKKSVKDDFIKLSSLIVSDEANRDEVAVAISKVFNIDLEKIE